MIQLIAREEDLHNFSSIQADLQISRFKKGHKSTWREPSCVQTDSSPNGLSYSTIEEKMVRCSSVETHIGQSVSNYKFPPLEIIHGRTSTNKNRGFPTTTSPTKEEKQEATVKEPSVRRSTTYCPDHAEGCRPRRCNSWFSSLPKGFSWKLGTKEFDSHTCPCNCKLLPADLLHN